MQIIRAVGLRNLLFLPGLGSIPLFGKCNDSDSIFKKILVPIPIPITLVLKISIPIPIPIPIPVKIFDSDSNSDSKNVK